MAAPSDRFLQSITYATLTGRDIFGKPVVGSQTTAAARVQPMRKLVRDDAGRESMSTHVVYTEAALTLRSRVWLPGATTSEVDQSRTPVAIDTLVDGSGATRFYKVWF